jgi:hypothetical protein
LLFKSLLILKLLQTYFRFKSTDFDLLGFVIHFLLGRHANRDTNSHSDNRDGEATDADSLSRILAHFSSSAITVQKKPTTQQINETKLKRTDPNEGTSSLFKLIASGAL